MNAGNKDTISMHHPRSWNVTSSMVGLKNSGNNKNTQKSHQKCLTGDIAWKAEEELSRIKSLGFYYPKQVTAKNNFVTGYLERNSSGLNLCYCVLMTVSDIHLHYSYSVFICFTFFLTYKVKYKVIIISNI